MTRTMAALAAWAMLATTAAAQERPAEDPPGPPGRLTPVDPYPSPAFESYIRACLSIMRVDEIESNDACDWGSLRAVVMVSRSPFDPESCVALRERRDGGGCELISVFPDRNIWFSLPEQQVGDDGEARDRKPLEVKVRSATKAVDPVRAARVFALWERALLGVRYPEQEPPVIEDAEVHEFRYRWKRMYGESQATTAGVAGALIGLGKAMIAVSDSQDDVDATLARLDKASDELETRLQEAQPGRDASNGPTEQDPAQSPR
ncbi:hypothetical protein [Planctomyces sp. SH-PL62]|uniref:hypothetical protein n=1 Tax=Planctomyces sp. SH-PL62 TaxID=1636152 RepID=UPI00078CAF61|nr:hypothetical protein [Planctomyces sp. SH-PL62]AMV38048.1 hypothetical protein VT85_11465 [Planctomyces sp. SH-PL62]